jgi:hypothetical protein
LLFDASSSTQVVNDAKMKHGTFSSLTNGNNTSVGESEPRRRLRAAALATVAANAMKQASQSESSSQSETLPSPGERQQQHLKLNQQQQRAAPSLIGHDPVEQSVRGWSRDMDPENMGTATADDIGAITSATQQMMAQLWGGDVLEK